MRMGKFAHLAVLAIGIACTGAFAAAQDVAPQHKKIFGYQDENGAFHAPHALPDAATSETLTGWLQVTFTITVRSTFPKGYVLFCNADFITSSVNEAAPTNPVEYEEDGASSTTTTTCTVKIPYSWVVTPASKTVLNSLSGTYEVFAINPTATGLASTIQLRVVSGTIVDSATLPANGATTPYAIAVTI